MNFLITGNKRILFFIIALSFTACGTDQGATKTYTYTAENESGVPIKVLAYNSLSITPNEITFSTTFENGNKITKTFQDGLPPSGYYFRDFFGSLNGRKAVVDSIKVIYNNVKYKSFNSKDCNGGNRNPLNICAYQSTEEIFIFTVEDYENAEDCNGDCE
jgi:hypothetical protein